MDTMPLTIVLLGCYHSKGHSVKRKIVIMMLGGRGQDGDSNFSMNFEPFFGIVLHLSISATIFKSRYDYSLLS